MIATRQPLADIGLDLRGDEAAWAAFSPCGKYRYALGRRWAGWSAANPLRTCLIGMQNPSTATDRKPDNTMRRCLSFAQREQCGAMIIVNVMAWRSAYPDEVIAAQKGGADIVGPANYEVVKRLRPIASRVLVGWGKLHASQKPHVEPFVAALRAGRPLWCLGKNQDGSPRHPLFLAADTPLVAWP